MVDAFAAIQPPSGPLDSQFEQGRCSNPMDGSNTAFIGTASGVVKARTINDCHEAQGSELTPNALEDDGGRVGIRAPVSQPHVAVPCLHWRLKFDRYDERHCAELTLSGLDTQTIVSDVPTQEQVVNKRWIIQNNAVPARKQSC